MEIVKAPGNKWDWYDILADAIGIVTGLFISSYIIEKASTYLVPAFICIIIFSALSLTSRAEFLLPI